MLVAVLDANVLIPNALCDLLLRLAEENLLTPRWSNQILNEVRRNLPRLNPFAVERRIGFMNAAFEEAMVEGYEHLEPMMLNHPKDRHVLAAAVSCDADLIITCNLRDFPAAACDPYGIEVEHPDAFLLGLIPREPMLVVRVVRQQAADTGRRGAKLLASVVLDHLKSAGAPRSADLIRQLL